MKLALLLLSLFTSINVFSSELVEIQYSMYDASCTGKVDPQKINPEMVRNGIKLSSRLGLRQFPMQPTRYLARETSEGLARLKNEIISFYASLSRDTNALAIPNGDRWKKIKKFELDQLALNQHIQVKKIDYFLSETTYGLTENFLNYPLPDECKHFAKILQNTDDTNKKSSTLGPKICEKIQDKKSAQCVSEKAKVLDSGWEKCINQYYRDQGYDQALWESAKDEIMKHIQDPNCEEDDSACRQPGFLESFQNKVYYGCLKRCSHGKEAHNESNLNKDEKDCFKSCNRPISSHEYKKEHIVLEEKPIECTQEEKKYLDQQNKESPNKNLICETKFANYKLTLENDKKVNLTSTKIKVFSRTDYFFIKEANLFLFGMYEYLESSSSPLYSTYSDIMVGTKVIHQFSGKQLDLKGLNFSPSFKRFMNIYQDKNHRWMIDVYESDKEDVKIMDSLRIASSDQVRDAYWVAEDKILLGSRPVPLVPVLRHDPIRGAILGPAPTANQTMESCILFKENKWIYIEETFRKLCKI